MNALIIINYLIFAALFPLLIIEFGGAIAALLDSEVYKKKVINYLAPLWEITGTLSVFYLVNLVATYPGLLPAIDYLYLAPLVIAAVFLIARDVYLAYSELNTEKKENRKHARAYGILTVLTTFLMITILSSSVSRGGVNPILISVNYSHLLLNGFNILIFDSIIALASASAIVLFDLKYPKVLSIMCIFAISLLLLGLKTDVPYILVNLLSNPYYLAPTVVVFLIMTIMYIIRSKYTKFLVIPLLFTGTLTFELLEYPYLFGGAININNFVAVPPTSSYILLFTILGGAFLVVCLTLFFYIHHSKKRGKRY